MITGEPLPTEKQTEVAVFAGTIHQNGYLRIRSEKVGADTTLAKIIQRVEEAQEAKAPAQCFRNRKNADALISPSGNNRNNAYFKINTGSGVSMC